MNEELLRLHLNAFVPLEIAELKRRGFTEPEDWQIERLREFSHTLAEQGDVLRFGGGRPGQAGSLVGQLVEALAVAAFMPYGIRIFGMRFEAYPENEEKQ